VKYRGYRIELGEIESAMRRTFGLHSVAVVLRGDGADAQLRAYHLASEAEGDLDMSALGELLPAYMIPSSVTALDVMPTNANGKIDRRTLL
jgi:acyl-coenzyme A synthetase/AMP-(fatty) acid ligase